MTTILAIDTATGPCSVAIWDGKIVAYVENAKPIMQSASLMPMVEEALAACGKTYQDLTLVAATIGPGSFTGIRVGLAAARGIAFATGIKSVGFTTLEVLAFGARHYGDNILAILNAGKGEWYWQLFSSPHRGEAGRGAGLGKPNESTEQASPHPNPPPAGEGINRPVVGALEIALASATQPYIIAGNAPGACPLTFPRADALAELAATATSSQELRPFYIRAPDAKLPMSS